MLEIYKSSDRGHFDHGWLDTRHTFSFAGYHDPRRMGFRALRVINEDRVTPGEGFGSHPHKDMEIVTYVLSGELAHRDNLGSESVLRAGEFQRMTAGSGITHSEYNASSTDPVHFYQIWLYPERKGLAPSYEQKAFPEADRRDAWALVASPDGAENSLRIRQDARLSLASLAVGRTLTYAISSDRHAWLQVLRGGAEFNGQILGVGDGAAVSGLSALTVRSTADSELLLFDLA